MQLQRHEPPVRLLSMIASRSRTRYAGVPRPTSRVPCFFVGLAALLLLTQTSLRADSSPDGIDALGAYTRGDSKTAMKLLRPMAEEGNTFAQFTICKMYVFGEGIPKDPAKGATFIRSAAEKGLAIAQLHLANLY